MEQEAALSKVAMYVTRGCLVVPIQVELHDELVLQIQGDILERVNKTGIKGVIIDVSGVAVIDSPLAQAISNTARMASLLGAKTVIIGLRPGVVASLVDLDFDIRGVATAVSLEGGFRLLAPAITPKEEPEEVEEAEEAGVEIRAPEEGEEEEPEEGDEDDKGREVERDEEENDGDEEHEE